MPFTQRKLSDFFLAGAVTKNLSTRRYYLPIDSFDIPPLLLLLLRQLSSIGGGRRIKDTEPGNIHLLYFSDHSTSSVIETLSLIQLKLLVPTIRSNLPLCSSSWRFSATFSLHLNLRPLLSMEASIQPRNATTAVLLACVKIVGIPFVSLHACCPSVSLIVLLLTMSVCPPSHT